MRARRVIAAMTAGTALVFIPLSARAGEAAPQTRALYRAHCARCHGETGHGDGPAATMQRPLPMNFYTGQFKYRSTPPDTLPLRSDVERIIANGILRHSMPPFGNTLDAQSIRDLAEYVLSFARSGSGLPQGAPAEKASFLDLEEPVAEALAKGREIFNQRCGVCHGRDGRGLGDAAPGLYDKNGHWILLPDLTDADAYAGGNRASDIAQRVAVGTLPGTMPAFGSALSESDIQAVAQYTHSLQADPSERLPVDEALWEGALTPRVRGEYLTRAMSCALCHNTYDADGRYDPEHYLAGGVAIHLPGLGEFYTRNITSHPAYGIGAWTEDEIARTLLTGYAPDRRLEAFSMPWVFFSHLRPRDALDIAAYLKNLKPVANRVPGRVYDPFWERLWERFKQAAGFSRGRLEYPPHNRGELMDEDAAGPDDPTGKGR